MTPDVQHREATLVVNTQSRRGLALYGRAKQELERQGVAVAEAFPVRDASRIAAVVEEAIGRGRRFIIVGGGDGTISSIASLFAEKDVVLGLLPLGTANNFARGNGIALDLAGAVRVLAKGRVDQVDLGRVDFGHGGGNVFTNAVSIGLTSAIHRGSPDPLKRAFGRAGYLMVALGRFRTSRPFNARLELDGRSEAVQAYDIRIANGPYHGGFPALPDASLDSGDLVVRVIAGPSPWSLGKVWMRIVLGRPIDPSLVRIFRARTIEIAAEPQQFVSVDGEVVTQTPARISIMPGALRLMVPQA
ncbi:MAG: YegS/Rv2252/BmrU family lipid kinase [Microvirga sp.]